MFHVKHSASTSIRHHAADRLAPPHQLKTFIDLLEWQDMRDQVVDVDLAVHVPVDDFRHIRAPARAAESRAFPAPARHELEWPCGNLLPRPCDADDDRGPPAAMATFQRLAHDFYIADALEAVIRAAIGKVHQIR